MKNYNQYILKFNEYNKLKTSFPHKIHFKNKNKELLYLGVNHTFDPENPLFDQIKKEFNKFKPKIALWEGHPEIDIPSEKRAKECGEATYLIYLAEKAHIPNETLEASLKDDIYYQFTKFSKDEVFAFFILRGMNTLKDSKPNTSEKDIVNWINKRIKNFESTYVWDNYDFSISNLKKIFKEITSKNLDFNLHNWEKETISPNYNSSVLNEIFRSSIEFRDIYTIKVIQEKISNYDRVFVIMGGIHSYTQEPALKKVFEDQ